MILAFIVVIALAGVFFLYPASSPDPVKPRPIAEVITKK